MRLRRSGGGCLQLHRRVLGLRRELQDLWRRFRRFLEGERWRSPDRQGSDYASRKRAILHGLLSAYKMSACSLDFKPVAEAVKSLLRQENFRCLAGVCGTVATGPRPTLAYGARAQKRDRPEGRALDFREVERTVRSKFGRPNRRDRNRPAIQAPVSC